MTRTEAPALPANSYSPRHAGTAPVVDSTRPPNATGQVDLRAGVMKSLSGIGRILPREHHRTSETTRQGRRRAPLVSYQAITVPS